MRTTKLAQLTVSAQGLGCMGMSESYGATDQAGQVAQQNVAALDITLTADELAILDPLADQVAGARY